MSAILTQNLTRVFGQKAALNQLNLDIPENSIVGLIGRNGAGKTTLMKVIAGCLRPSSGSIRVFGEAPFDNLKVLSDMIYMDDDRYSDSSQVRDVLDLAALSYRDFDKKTAIRLLDYFGISLKAKIKKLSKGTKTLFSLVVAILARCPLTMLDEPTLGLDASHRKEFASLLLKDFSDHPRCILISSHLISELEGLMDQIVLIDQGRLVFHKTLEEVQSHALYLTGHRKVLDALAPQYEVLSREMMGERMVLGVLNSFTEPDLMSIRQQGIDVSPMSVQDVCVHLTASKSGGVLDVIGQ